MGGLFRTVGPVVLQRTHSGVSDLSVREMFVSNSIVPYGIGEAIGVYVVARRDTNGILIPWYVGKTEKGFFKRFTQHSKLKKSFGDVARIPIGGELNVFLIALVSEKSGKFRKPVSSAHKVLSIKTLEERLIGTCLRLNADLLNTSNKTLNEGLRVPGYVGEEGTTRDASASELARMLKII